MSVLTISNSPPVFPWSCFDQALVPPSAETFLKTPSDFHVAQSWLTAPFSSPTSYLWQAGAPCSASVPVPVLAISPGLWSQGFKYHPQTSNYTSIPSAHTSLQARLSNGPLHSSTWESNRHLEAMSRAELLSAPRMCSPHSLPHLGWEHFHPSGDWAEAPEALPSASRSPTTCPLLRASTAVPPSEHWTSIQSRPLTHMRTLWSKWSHHDLSPELLQSLPTWSSVSLQLMVGSQNPEIKVILKKRKLGKLLPLLKVLLTCFRIKGNPSRGLEDQQCLAPSLLLLSPLLSALQPHQLPAVLRTRQARPYFCSFPLPALLSQVHLPLSICRTNLLTSCKAFSKRLQSSEVFPQPQPSRLDLQSES